MDTLLTEIIGFLRTAKGIPACEAGPQLCPYFNMVSGAYCGLRGPNPIFTTEALRHGEEQNQPQITQTGADQKKRSQSRLNFRKILTVFFQSAFICAISGKSFLFFSVPSCLRGED
jgi:hypothetical protein